MELYLVRHGETHANRDGIVCGQMDTPLTERGIAQAKSLYPVLASIKFDAFITTPLQRAYQTAKFAYPSADYIQVPELMETDVGIASEWPAEKLYIYDDRFKNHGLHYQLKYPNGESIQDMYDRITTWLNHFLETSSSLEKVLIIGHLGTVNTILHYFFTTPLFHYPAFEVRNASISVVDHELKENTTRLVLFNEVNYDV